MLIIADVALNWLTCFPISAKKHLYDVFFLRGIVSEVVQSLVPYLQHHLNGRLEASICSNTERYCKCFCIIKFLAPLLSRYSLVNVSIILKAVRVISLFFILWYNHINILFILVSETRWSEYEHLQNTWQCSSFLIKK